MFHNQKGQGLIEYLIIVALMAVAAISIVKLLNKTVQVQFANVIWSLQNRQGLAPKHERLKSGDYEKKDFGNFMNDSDSAGGGF